jgi:tRNA pseudouridine55 synthase
MTTINGILNLYKPAGMTSHDVVAKVRRILREKRVGHAGTLDPAATGVLPLCVGQATRLVEYLSDANKIYCAEATLGVTTDTYDREGQVTSQQTVPDFTLAELDAAAESLRGAIMQLPPIFSAIKMGGQPLYKAARAGTADQIELKPRPVTIHRLDIHKWESPVAQLWVECSKGTYIRSLVHDLGQKLGCGAYMSDLVRVQSGPFHIRDAATLQDLEQQGAALLQPLDIIIADWPAWVVDDQTAVYIRQGRDFSVERMRGIIQTVAPESDKPFRRVYSLQGDFIAILEKQGAVWHPAKVFGDGG